MKLRIKKLFGIAVILLMAGFCLPGCSESHYYHHYHHHTRPWYDRHHRTPPAGVNFDIDVRR